MAMEKHGSSYATRWHVIAVAILATSLILGMSNGQRVESSVIMMTQQIQTNSDEPARNNRSGKLSGTSAASSSDSDSSHAGGNRTQNKPVRETGVKTDKRDKNLESTSTASTTRLLFAAHCPTNCTCVVSQGSLSITCYYNESTDFETQLAHITLPKLPTLASLTIHQSPLRNMSRGGICKLNSLVYLDLRNNKLADIPAGCFAGMSNLKSLSLGANNLQKLRDGVFDGLSQIATISINSNSISHIEPHVFANHTMFSRIQSIELMNNNLTSVDIWPLYLGVHRDPADVDLSIKLSNNDIAHVTNHLGWLYDPTMGPAIVDIEFDSNPITHMISTMTGWNITKELIMLRLYSLGRFHTSFIDCPLNCDCKDFLVYKYLRWAKWTHMANLLVCAKPDSLYDRLAIRVPLDELVCDLVEECPRGCQCVQQPSSRTLYIHCRGTQMVTLPREIPKKPQHYYKVQLEFQDNAIPRIDSRYYFRDCSHVNFASNRIQNITMSALQQFQNVSQIYLQHNRISTLPKEIKDLDFSAVTELGLYQNPFSCHCEDAWIKAWLQGINRQGKLSHPEGISCGTPDRLNGSNILTLDAAEFCRDPTKENTVNQVIISVSSIAGTIILFFIPVLIVYRLRGWIYRKFHWHPFDNDECDDEEKEFDAFISYANPDENWVIDLVEKLEAEDFRVLFHKRDFIGGLPITENVGQSVEKSKRVICVLSENYLKSNMCMWEFTATINVDLEEKKHRTIVIKFESLPEVEMNPTMRAYIRSHTYIDSQSKHFMPSLLYSMPQSRLEHNGNVQAHENMAGTQGIGPGLDRDGFLGVPASDTSSDEDSHSEEGSASHVYDGCHAGDPQVPLLGFV